MLAEFSALLTGTETAQSSSARFRATRDTCASPVGIILRGRLFCYQWLRSDAGNDSGGMLEELVDLLLASSSDQVESDGLCREDRGARDLYLHLRLRSLPGLQPTISEFGEKPAGGRVDLPGGGFEAFPELFVDADVLADRPRHGCGSLFRADTRTIFREAAHVRDSDSDRSSRSTTSAHFTHTAMPVVVARAFVQARLTWLWRARSIHKVFLFARFAARGNRAGHRNGVQSSRVPLLISSTL